MDNLNKIDNFLNNNPKVGEEVCDLQSGVCYIKTVGKVQRDDLVAQQAIH
jgi:hypothetical protein